MDDEEDILQLVKFNLEKEGYEVLLARDGVEALSKVKAERPDLILLDVMLPKLDGFEVCRQVRKETAAPVLFLSAKGEEIDRVLGLELGADDYITKPFSPRELVARVKAHLRRAQTLEEPKAPIRFGEIELDPVRHGVLVRGTEVQLTPKEFKLLETLMVNRGQVFSRDFLLQKVWGYNYTGDTRTVDVHIRRLRQKIEQDPTCPRYIETVHGFGYRMRDPA